MDDVQLVLDDQNKNGMIKKLVENIDASLYWHAPVSSQILDLKERHYNDVLRLIKRHFFSQDPVCRAFNLLGDSISTQSYLDFIQLWMKDTTSLVAVSSNTGRVVGAAIARINTAMDRSNTYSRIQILNGEAFEKIMFLKNAVIKQTDAYEQLKSDTYFRIYILCVHPSYEAKGLTTALLEAFIQMSIALQMPAIGGIFTTSVSQELATNLGLKLLTKIRYNRWGVDDAIVRDNPGIFNNSTAFMGMQTPSLDYLKKIWQDRESSVNEKKARRKNRHRHISNY